MPRSTLALCVLSAALFLCSCSKKVYTHKQVMQSFHTKDDVVKKFGIPDVKRTIDSTEEWIYNHNVQPRPSNPAANTAASYVDTSKKTSVSPQQAYMLFLFDDQGNVVGYKSNGVDLGYVKKVSAGSNILRGLGIAAILVVIIGLDIYGNGNVSF